MQGNFYVRVKRNRDEHPLEQLCIIEDSSIAPDKHKKRRSVDSLSTQLSGLHTSSSTKDPKRILLQRIRTTDRSNNEVTTSTDQISDVNHTTSSKMADSIILRVVSSSLAQISSVENPSSSAVAVIDMTMSTPYSNRPIQAGTTSNTNEHMKTSHRILDPATRLLDKGIATAIRNGDFNDLSAALIQGADPNYQMVSSSGGYTALMAAATKSNVRMVRRLLLKAVDVLAVNADGKTALDLVPTKLTARNSSDVTEIRSLIVRAVEAEGQRSRLKAFVESESCSSDNYVYDIYSVSSAVDAAAVSSEAPFSAVQVEGLKIVGESNIDIDLLLSYDSDWSDLGEDEDPDSNDERFHGNDYPEEAASDEEDLLDPAYDDDDDLDDAAAENSSDDEMPHSSRMGRSYSDRRDMSIGKGRLDGDNSDYDEDVDVQYDNAHEAQSRPTGCQLPRSTADRIAALDRSFGVGKVIRPAVIFDTGASSRPFGPLDTESLQLLWEESPPAQVDDDDDADGGSKDRIDQMRNRTGMVFASNPREFDAHGLPKYACDLSDDDGDALCEYGSHSRNPHFNNSRPSLDAVAYDSELDRDSDDA